MNNNKNSMKVRPVISYSDIEMNKDNIYKENKKRSGIYRWINKINNKSYIGSAVNLSKRFRMYYNYNHLSSLTEKKISVVRFSLTSWEFEVLNFYY